MRKGFFSVLMIIGAVVSSKAQTISPSVLASGGGSAKTSSGSLDWTLGEFAVETIYTDGKIYTQGFNQPFLIIRPSVVLTPAKSFYKISVAPNPVHSILNFKINSLNDIQVSVTVADIHGKMLLRRKVNSAGGYLQIDFTGLAAGSYVLTVREAASGQIIQSFEIIKL
jgi:hypothetical protein